MHSVGKGADGWTGSSPESASLWRVIMSAKANPARNVYAFSLRGVAAMNSYAFVPAIADDAINNALDQEREAPRQDRPRLTRMIEDLLAGYLTAGYRRAV